jgi:NAD(P)-dependent dehydrogenase (short-subunit alcohol dehydrogenase family)
MKAEQLFDVRGKVTFVSGAAMGIGFGLAEVMADNGARVTMADIDADALEATARKLRDRGLAVDTVVLDVGDTAKLHAAIDETARKGGSLDVVFANAGASAGPGFRFNAGWLDQVERATWDRVLDINLTSVFETIRAAARHMKQQKSGRIIVTSSIAGIRSEDMVGYAYIATKSAVNHLVGHAARELAPDNVLINAIAPGAFMTNIAGGRLKLPEVRAEFASMSLLKRVADVDEIKGLALYLASPASSFMTGAVIPIDGGATV